jgi:hypothetical protein
MNKNQKILLGVGVVGVAAYFYWKSKQPATTAKFVGQDGTIFHGRPNRPLFAQASGKYGNLAPQASCMCHTATTNVGGDTAYTCKNGNHAWSSKGPCPNSGAK